MAAVTKRKIARRQRAVFGSYINLCIAPLLLWGAAEWFPTEEPDWPERMGLLLAIAGLLILKHLIYFFDRRPVLKKIERQEAYLGVSFDEDMKGVQMGSGFLTDVEAVSKGDWYVLLSKEGVFAVNRRYITGVKHVNRSHGNKEVWMEADFDTADHAGLFCKTGNSAQAVLDLCKWLEYPQREIRNISTSFETEVEHVDEKTETEDCPEDEIHWEYEYD